MKRFAAIVLAATMFVTVPATIAVADPQPRPQHASRGAVNRYIDSGSAVWRTAPKWIRTFGLCVRRHESLRAGHYRAVNRSSGAGGAYQFLRSTWRVMSKRAGYPGYASAQYAPPSVQDAVFIYTVRRSGPGHWRGTHCGFGT